LPSEFKSSALSLHSLAAKGRNEVIEDEELSKKEGRGGYNLRTEENERDILDE
jgi:hypothetical protein